MTGGDPDRASEPSAPRGRRAVLELAGSLGAFGGLGVVAYTSDRRYVDEDGDGIPDSKERSGSFHDYLRGVFGADQFEGLDPRRKDLLVDARYVGDAGIADPTKARIAELFRENGIFLQWLDHPRRYDRERFEERYGYGSKDVLWASGSFYREEVEEPLRNVALQLIVLPGGHGSPGRARIHSWPLLSGSDRDGTATGVSYGNRAVAVERESVEAEAKLVLHELAHLGLCHDDDPDNIGVMGTGQDLDLADQEWETLRANLENVRDTTGFDILFRRCILEEFASWAGDEVR